MRLLAISDLHLGAPANMEALAELPAHAGDWLIVANPVFDWDLSDGLESCDPNFSASLKVTRKVMEGVAAGIEYYGDLGKFTHISPWEQQDQRIRPLPLFDEDVSTHDTATASVPAQPLDVAIG